MFGRFVRRRGKPKRLRCRTKRTSPNKKKRKTTQSKLMRSDVLTQTFSPHELTFAFLAIAKADKSPGATTQGRAQMSIWISVQCACLPACLPACERQLRKKEHQKAPPPPPKTNLQTGYESARQRIVNVLTCASSHCNH